MFDRLTWVAIVLCSALLILALARAGLRRPSWFRTGRSAALIGAFLTLLGLLFVDTANRSPSAAAGSTRVVYLGWSDARIVEHLARRWPSGRTLLVVNPAARGLCQRGFPAAEVLACAPGDNDLPGDGVTAEAAFRDLGERLPGLPGQTAIYFVAPRALSAADCHRRGQEVVRKHPHLRDRLHVVQPEDMGLKWPSLVIEAPLAVSPDLPDTVVSLIGRDLPQDTRSVEFRALGPKQGGAHLADSESTVAHVGQDASGQLALEGSPIRPSPGDTTLRGKLPTPKEGKSLTFDAATVNSFGEVLAWSRTTMTSRTQPIGVLVPQSRKGITGPLQALLDDLQLDYEDVVLPLHAGADTAESVRRLHRWRVLLCDHPLSAEEGGQLQRVLRQAPVKPVLLFVGSGSDTGELPPGWRALMKEPLEPKPCRVVLVTSDKSGSMSMPCGAGQMKKYEMAMHLAKRLARGLEQRRWNRLVQPIVGPDGNTTGPDGKEVTLENYAEPNQAWELEHMLVAVSRLLEQGHPISDLVAVFDPEDVSDTRSDGGLSKEALDAAERLHKKGVKLWLIAAGPDADVSALVKDRPELRGLFAASVRCSLQGHGNDPGRLLAHVEKLVLEEMFPRLAVEATGDGPGLTRPGHEKLRRYVDAHAAHLRLLNGLVGFAPADRHPQARQAALWLRRWDGSPDQVAPLLVHGHTDLGDGSTGTHLHLALDLTAERAKIPSGTSPQRNSLAGLIVRVVGALSDEMQQPAIYWLPAGGGLGFFTAEHKPFQIRRDAGFDRETLRGAGLALRPLAGPGQGRADSRRLELPTLTPEHLDRATPTPVRFVIEDERPEVGRLGLTLTLTAPPPTPLRADARALGAGADPAGEEAAGPAEWALPGWAVPVVFAAFWAALALALRDQL